MRRRGPTVPPSAHTAKFHSMMTTAIEYGVTLVHHLQCIDTGALR